MSDSVYEEAERRGEVLPEATDTGSQSGVVPPSLRKHAARYEAVSLAEAERRMLMRMKGEMPDIEGGLDGPGEIDPVKAGGPSPNSGGPGAVDDDKPGMVAGVDYSDKLSPEGESSIPANILNQLASLLSNAPGRVPAGAEIDPFTVGDAPVSAVTAAPPSTPSPVDDYLARRVMVSFGVAGGTYSVPAVAVEPSATGLVVILPAGAGAVSFVPSMGSQVTVGSGSSEWDCFFPGIRATIDALGVTVLGFIFSRDPETGEAP